MILIDQSLLFHGHFHGIIKAVSFVLRFGLFKLFLERDGKNP
jgi:hypothetical protein